MINKQMGVVFSMVLVVGLLGCYRYWVKPNINGTPLPVKYSNDAAGFSLHLPSLLMANPDVMTTDKEKYTVDETYHYQALGPGKEIGGLKFTIPTLMATGTNLSPDSFLSVEQIPQTKDCSAARFVPAGAAVKNINEKGVMYSVAMVSEAAAGNRYEETVYALPGTNPCMAIRYFIHYGVLENYPEGSVKPFDKQALIEQFDAIRWTLVVSQK